MLSIPVKDAFHMEDAVTDGAALQSIFPDHTELLCDVLRCAVCMERMFKNIATCSEGHSMCVECHERLTVPKICPTCRTELPRQVLRNRPLEMIIAKCEFPCQHSCGLVANPQKLLEHESACFEALLPCPFGITDDRCTKEVRRRDVIAHMREYHRGNHIIASQMTDRHTARLSPSKLNFETSDFTKYASVTYVVQLDGEHDAVIVKLQLVEPREGRKEFLQVHMFHVMKQRTWVLTIGNKKRMYIEFGGKTLPFHQMHTIVKTNCCFDREHPGLTLHRETVCMMALEGESIIPLEIVAS